MFHSGLTCVQQYPPPLFLSCSQLADPKMVLKRLSTEVATKWHDGYLVPVCIQVPCLFVAVLLGWCCTTY